MTAMLILPTRVGYVLGESIALERRGTDSPGILEVRRLGELVRRLEWADAADLELGSLEPGGYTAELRAGDDLARTALEVGAEPGGSARYGFVVDFSSDRDTEGTLDLVRRLHLTDVQFYDWGYRHADLLGGGPAYVDPLGRTITLETVRDLAARLADVGANALGYAAVYGVGNDEWEQWRHRALLNATGEPYGLGDFLSLVDPAAQDWLDSFTSQLAAATASVGFAGFHLDQYGYPKHAHRPDGVVVDVAASFMTAIERIRRTLPDSRLIFNNVNDFPTWLTGHSPQDAVYIEVWPPHTTLGSLADLVNRARSVAEGKPIIIAAYQHVYAAASAEAADLATRFTMATLFSHGATQLLAGESGRLLVDPYYARNHAAEPSTLDMLARWYDFLVAHGELLSAPGIVEVTGSYAGQYNGDCDVAFGSHRIAERAEPGTVWRRITQVGDSLVLHLVNLLGQTDAEWDAERRPVGSSGPGVLTFRRVGTGVPRVRVADPDRQPILIDVPVRREGELAIAELPDLGVWQVVVIDPVDAAEELTGGHR